jgi:hypothetical protein
MRFGTCGGRTSSRLPSRACLRTLPSRPSEEQGARPHAGLSAAGPWGFMGSRRAANARDRAYAIVQKSAAREPQTRINRAIARQSSPIVASLEQACHAGGRGFESRRSRLKIPANRHIVLPVGRQFWPSGQQTNSWASGCRPVHPDSSRAFWLEPLLRRASGSPSARHPAALRLTPPRAEHRM